MRLACCLVVVAACGERPPGVLVEPVLCEIEAQHPATTGVFEDDMRFVAHALGAPTGLLQEEHYTNSREAFDASYHNGFRAYEVDLVMLADGTVAAVHDAHESYYGLARRFGDITRADLEGRKWQGKYEVLFAEDLVQLMVDHPDVWLILDTKCCDAEIAQVFVDLAPDDSVRNRMVPHVTGDAHAMALPSIHPFPEMLYARYQWPGSDAVVKLRMDMYGIDNVMMWWDAAHNEWNEGVQAMMENAGYHVWVHTPEDPGEIESYAARGIGVYTNGYITCPE